MSEQNGQERTERASPRRQQEARDRGQVARSRDFNSFALLAAATLGILFTGERLFAGLADVYAHAFTIPRAHLFDDGAMALALAEAGRGALLACLPLIAVLTLTALVAPVAVGGWVFSAQAIGVKFERLDPLKGLKRVFSYRGIVELIKALAKFVLVAMLAAWLAWRGRGELLGLGTEPLEQGLTHAAAITVRSLLWFTGALAVIAAFDAPWQWWDHMQGLRMTRQESRDEIRETEGRPEVRQKLRERARELAKRRMMSEIPKADVIVVNPTHFAVALRYDERRMRAPRVVAKGADLVAMVIRGEAAKHRVPVLSAPPLARALFYSTELGHDIPQGLYQAVAQLLAYVFQLRTAPRPPFEPDWASLDIPSDLAHA